MFLKALNVLAVVSISVLCTSSAGLPALGVKGTFYDVDRSLYVRNLPAVDGYQSNLYEIYMEPFAYNVRPLLASATLLPNAGNGRGAGGDADTEAESVTPGPVYGELVFSQTLPPGGHVLVRGNITGLTPGKHAIHVHEYGDTRKGCESAGGHFNPYQLHHGAPHDAIRHIGDLGNIVAGDDGTAEVKILDPLLSLLPGPRGIVGRSIVIHAMEDDLGRADTVESQTSGSAGARIACGVIGYVNG
uniref:superoxide dismutase n=1 Tax=Protohermes xanthodes TaxID=1452977 RepID=A0AA96R1T4_9NEOP|nr:copper-zinc superoxide dismutase 3 [Protohermes xanthodes]